MSIRIHSRLSVAGLCFACLWLALTAQAADQPSSDESPPAKNRRLQPKQDPPDQLFRYAPMAASPRSIAINLRQDFHAAFDTELLRIHTLWHGDGLNLFGPPYHGDKTPFICAITGDELWTMPGFVPWSFTDPSKEERWIAAPDAPRAQGHFKSLQDDSATQVRRVTLAYELLGSETARVQIAETLSAPGASNDVVLTREFRISPYPKPIWHLVQAADGKAIFSVNPDNGAAMLKGSNTIFAAACDSPLVAWRPWKGEVRYSETIFTEKGSESGNPTNEVTGQQARLWLEIPAHAEEIRFTLRMAIGAPPDGAARAIDRARSATLAAPAKAATSKAVHRVTADRRAIRKDSGDDFYRIEHFPAPKEIDLLVGGMDWLPNGDLAVAAWPGDVYIVEHAQGKPEQATYRRFARGLHEPLGLKVVDGEIYVAQKSELLRLRDRDGNGEADSYECIANEWGYAGNYHSYTFGPLPAPDGKFLLFTCGQRGRWDLPYMGWAFTVDPATRQAEPFCSGLRVPNGIGYFGPDRDLFMADNQGNWVGTCKLNHLQKGKFYGYPSSWPASNEKPAAFAPPALWLPRKLSPSASGLAEITDARFGPFQGQMIIGDFQNAILMRALLEKVGGEWQGAVCHFAKGFLSAVNRVSFGPDGKLYVGGCKRTWSSASPQEYSLDRVSFSGQVPFEVKEMHATKDGFELLFTKELDPAEAILKDNYFVSQFGYKYHAEYGSPEIDHDGKPNSATEIEIASVAMDESRLKVRLGLKGLRPGYVTMLKASVLDAEGNDLRNDTLYYTLNRMPL